jgi:hypothetical protein
MIAGMQMCFALDLTSEIVVGVKRQAASGVRELINS